MSVTINFSKNTSAPWQSNANMLKARGKNTETGRAGRKNCFFETQKQNLKNQKADTIEEIAKSWRSFILTRMRLRQQNRSTTAHRCSTS